MKRITFATTAIICLTVFLTASLAQDVPPPANAPKTATDGKGALSWSLPFASQAMTDNLNPQKPPEAAGGASGNRAKFDHISDNTPRHQGIAPQKSQK